MFGTNKSIISNGGSHICNNLFKELLEKYGVCHNMVTAYDPQTSGHVKMLNLKIKQILVKTVNSNRMDWLRKINDSLRVYHTAYKTPLVCRRSNLSMGRFITYRSI